MATRTSPMDDPETRERYDRTWAYYPYEHPSAYWLRSDGEVILCLRCSTRTVRPGLDDDPAVIAAEFVRKHLECKLGHGLRDPKARTEDPLLAH